MLAFPECSRAGSVDPSGCLNLAASKAELVPELVVAGSVRLPASEPTAVLLGRIHSSFSAEVWISWTGGSSAVVVVQFEDRAVSSDATAVPVVLSVGADEEDSVSLAGSDESGFGAGVF